VQLPDTREEMESKFAGTVKYQGSRKRIKEEDEGRSRRRRRMKEDR
jgi:hypothetical protein